RTLKRNEIPRPTICAARKVVHDVLGHTPGTPLAVTLMDFQLHDRGIAAMVFAFRQNRHQNQITDVYLSFGTRDFLLAAVVDFAGAESRLAAVQHPLDAVAAFVI